MAPLYGIALDELISFDAALSGLRQAIEKTNGQAEKAVGWTSEWGKRYSVLLRCQAEMAAQGYARSLDAMLDELRQKYRFSSGIEPTAPSASAVHTPASCTRAAVCYEEQAGMLALKDILYQTWRSRKRENRITRGGRFFERPPFLQGRRAETARQRPARRAVRAALTAASAGLPILDKVVDAIGKAVKNARHRQPDGNEKQDGQQHFSTKSFF